MPLTDFGLLPPEMNSGLMYAGPGSGPMMAAAAAWSGLAAELGLAASSYHEAISELTGAWNGPAATSMAAAAAPYVEWMSTTAAQAEQTASQMRVAAAGYGAAFAATVPPPVIAQNRAMLATLVATNILGQNTPAIAANQAEYAVMWAQDAAAMYGYASSAEVATKVTPFTAPPKNTNPAGEGSQLAATQAAGMNEAGQAAQTVSAPATQAQPGIPSWLQDILNFNPATTQLGQDFLDINGTFSGMQGLVGGFGYTASGTMFTIVPGVNAGITASAAMTSAMSAAVPVSAVSGNGAMGAMLASGSSTSGSLGLAGTGMSAGLGQAGSIGGVSVPPTWGGAAGPASAAAPGVRLAATASPSTGVAGAPMAGTGGMYGMPMLAGALNTPKTGEPNSRFGSRMQVLPQPSRGDGGDDPSNARAQRGMNSTTGRNRFTERDELADLRKTAAELAVERDVLHRTAVKLLKDAAQK